MWGFLKRQLKTKTGKAAIGLITGVVVNAVAGHDIAEVMAPVVNDSVVNLINGAFDPLAVPMSILGMYLRDRQAKIDERRRNRRRG